MKKIYFLCLLFCMSIAAHAQTVVVYASGATGSSTTASILKTTTGVYSASDDLIKVTNSTTTGIQVGYAQFDLSSIPYGAYIASVTLGVNLEGFTPAAFTSCNTYARMGPLAGVAPATAYAECLGGTGGTEIFTSGTAPLSPYSYRTTLPSDVGGIRMASTPSVANPLCNMVQNYANTAAPPTPILTVSFTNLADISGTTDVYNFTGETGSLDTLGGTSPAAPFLIITYCFRPTGVTATILPNPICAGQTFSLTGTATGATNYQWSGPVGSGFTASTLDATGIATTGSGGVYTFTASTACGAFFASTVTVTNPGLTVLPSPASLVTGLTTVCSGSSIFMSDITPGGSWSSSNTFSATVNIAGPGEVVGGTLAGTPIISYSIGNCSATAAVTVNNPPLPISGPTAVCEGGGIITLSDAITGGTWTSTNSGIATVDPHTGVVTGTTTGTVNINYVTGGCSFVFYTITVNPLPAAIILGAPALCVDNPLYLSDPTAGGTRSSNNTSLATVNPVTGVATGVSTGSFIVSYIVTSGCYITAPITINPAPAPITGPTEVCIGTIIHLSDLTPGGAWSSSSNPTATVTALGVVTGVAANEVNILYTLPVTGCFYTHSVTVNPLPGPISGTNTFCALTSVFLTDGTPLGQWSSQLTTIATVDPLSGEVTGVAGGVSNISYTITLTGCSVDYPVTINPLPAAVITPSGPVTFCAGGSVTLNATTGAGYIYAWFSNGLLVVPTDVTPAYTSNSTELIKLQVTDANGCVNTDSVQVTLIPNVTIAAGGPVVFCQTGNVLLSVPLAPAILYQWQLNGVDIPGAVTNTYAATLNGVYTCNLNVPGGCSVTTPGFTVTVHPLPNPIVYFSGTMLTTGTGFLTYQWYINSVAIPGATTNAVAPTTNASYRVRVTDGNGCTNYSAGFVITDLGVEQINKTNVSIYPNPANSVVHIVSTVSVRAVITGMEGKTLIEQTDATEMDISKLPEGIYMIQLYDKNGDRLLVQKLIKE